MRGLGMVGRLVCIFVRVLKSRAKCQVCGRHAGASRSEHNRSPLSEDQRNWLDCCLLASQASRVFSTPVTLLHGKQRAVQHE
jgi:hypothetical protein